MTGLNINGLQIQWTTPDEIINAGSSTWPKIKIFRSAAENTGYQEIDEIDSYVNGAWVTTYTDSSQPMTAKYSYYYLIRYYNPNPAPDGTSSSNYPAFPTLTPREYRLIQQLRSSISPFISEICTDYDLNAGLLLALHTINLYPPITNFSLNDFPKYLEPILYMVAMVFSLFSKYLTISFTDINYTDNGLSLTLDRGGKIKEAVDYVWSTLTQQLLPLAKMEYVSSGYGVGTLMLPTSVGSNLSRGLLNILDLMNTIGR